MEKSVGDIVSQCTRHEVRWAFVFFWPENQWNLWGFFLPCIYVVPISTKSQSLISTKSQYQIDKKCYQYTKIVFYSWSLELILPCCSTGNWMWINMLCHCSGGWYALSGWLQVNIMFYFKKDGAEKIWGQGSLIDMDKHGKITSWRENTF